MKSQIPTSKLQRRSKFQAPNETFPGGIGGWNLELVWDLELGAWSLQTQ